jgi:hypothetical protein
MNEPQRPLDEFFGDIGLEAQEKRAMLWPIVNWLLPLRFTAAGVANDMLAMHNQPLPTVPRQGESREVLGARARIERVQWTQDGRVLVGRDPASRDRRAQGGRLDGVSGARR